MAIPTLTDFTMSGHTTMASVDENAYYEHSTSLHFADADGDVLTYSASLADGSILPSWLSMNATTGILSGTPTYNDIASINITVTATDITGGSISDSYTLTVNNTNTPPELLGDDDHLYIIREQELFSFDATNVFTDADGDELTYAAQVVNEYEEYSEDTGEYNWVRTVSDLPEWLSIDAQTGVISGTPGNDDVTTVQFATGVHTNNVYSGSSEAEFSRMGEGDYQRITSDYNDNLIYYKDVVKNYESGISIHKIVSGYDSYYESSYSKTNESGVVVEQIDRVGEWGGKSVETVKLFNDNGNLTQSTVQTQLADISIYNGVFDDFNASDDYESYASYVDEFIVNYFTAESTTPGLLDNYASKFGQNDGNTDLFVKDYFDSQGVPTDTTYVIRVDYGYIEFDGANSVVKAWEVFGSKPEYKVTTVISTSIDVGIFTYFPV